MELKIIYVARARDTLSTMTDLRRGKRLGQCSPFSEHTQESGAIPTLLDLGLLISFHLAITWMKVVAGLGRLIKMVHRVI